MLRLLPFLLLLLLPAGDAFGAPADIDRGFGSEGRATVDLGAADRVAAVAAQPDGKLVIAGWVDTPADTDVAVARVNADGSPDRGFGTNGVARIESAAYEVGYGVAVQADGKVVVAGGTEAGSDGAVYRLNSDGSPDRGFGTQGVAIVDSAGYEVVYDVAIQPDGGIVVAGYTSVNDDLAVYRLTAGGQPDKTFDEDGARGIDAGGDERAYAVALQPDGKIVVAGDSYIDDFDYPLVARFTATGEPDSSFGTGGWRRVTTPGAFEDIAVQPDGRIVTVGYAGDDAVARRFRSDGLPDTSFAGDGALGLDTGSDDWATAVALQADGKILVGGATEADYDGVVWRLNGNGSRDGGFGSDGELILPAADLQEVRALAIQADGKIALAGVTEGEPADALLYRLLGEFRAPQPDPAGGGGGGPVTPVPVVRCAGRTATIVGTARRDVIRGTRRRDVIAALAGNDVVRGLGGNDVICGGPGRDRLLGGAGRDRLVGGPGRDHLIGGPGRDRTR